MKPSLFLNPHGTDVGKKVELPPQRYVGTLHRSALGGFRRSLQEHVARLYFFQNIFGYRSPRTEAVFKRQPVDIDELRLSRFRLLLQERREYLLRLSDDNRADSVPVDQPYSDFFLSVLPRGGIFHPFRPRALRRQKRLEFFRRLVDFRLMNTHAFPSFV